MGKAGRSVSSRSSAGRRKAPAGSSRWKLSEPAWVTVAQLCQRWQLDRKTIYKFIDSKILPAWKVGAHLYRISIADVLRFESRNRLPIPDGKRPASRSRSKAR
jgi:excisionase family DNA binding protein